MKRTDQELIEAIKQGEQESACLLYERHYAMTVKVALKIVRSVDDALDISQEVFMRLLVQKKIHDFRGESQFSTWLYRIVINRALTFLKQRNKAMEAARQNFVENSTTHTSHPEQLRSLESSEKQDHIREALDTLPGLYGHCLYLRFYEGRKYKEIAKKLKITRDRVGMQILRSRTMLNKNRDLREMYAS